MGKYFGTDGIRGVAGAELDAELAFKAGRAAATVLALGNNERSRVLIARDTRISCDMLEAAFSAGLSSAGADVTLLGVLPTPAVAYLTVVTKASAGVAITASHNTFENNGIKIFGSNGFKLSDALEERIEQLIDDDSEVYKRTGADLGRISGNHVYWTDEYVKSLTAASKGQYPGKIALDCANGSSYETARALFRGLEAKFEVLADEPDGININENCGSTHIDVLQEYVLKGSFDIGFAFDGDADRCLIVDEKGEVVDGDKILAVIARDMLASGTLKGNAIVGTVNSNSGMSIFARDNGFDFLRAQTGDRYVLEMMQEKGCNLGGETSGHIIFSDDATTGDGQLTAIKFLNVLTASGKTVSELVGEVPSFPQVMLNFRYTGGAEQRDAIMSNKIFLDAITQVEETLADDGRVLVRPSGTEPVIRVMVEAGTEALAEEKASHLISVLESL
ncbi:MAG: phosphoglucosamine mutase [Oscillospiraceae bacterium]|nr:phosphoglucosamine mutase [Oscillospiraceae bacterium]